MPLSERQKQIIDASVHLIAEGGIQDLTIKKIGATVGISEPAIYRHFASKIDIVLAVLDSFGGENELIFETSLNSTGSVVERLSMVWDSFFRRFEQKPAIAAVIFADDIFRNDPRLVEKLMGIRQRSRGHLLRIVEEGRERGELREDIPAEQMSLIIMGALRLFVLQWRLAGCRPGLVGEGRRLWEVPARCPTRSGRKRVS